MLESQVVEHVFARMLARYGSAWFTKWDAVPTPALKADWGRQIQGLSREALLWGLDHLPEDLVPNAGQFRRLCMGAPRQPALPEPRAPKADPKRVAAAMAQIPMLMSERDRLDWARDLQRRERAGDFLTFAQRDAWRHALGREMGSTAMPDDYQPIPTEALPAAMRPDAAVFEPDRQE